MTTEKRTGCPVCGNFILSHMELCNPCQEQKNTMEEMKRQRKRDKAFGNPWDFALRRDR